MSTVAATAPKLTVLPGGAPEVERELRLRDRAKELTGLIDSGYMELGKILYQISDAPKDKPHEQSLYQRWGFPRFEDYVEKELGMGVRKANRLKAIYYKLEVDLVGLSEATKIRFIGLGYTKARELIRVVNGRSILEWCEKAEKATAEQVYNMVQQYLTEVEGHKKRQVDAAFAEVADDRERSVPAPKDAFEAITDQEEGAPVTSSEPAPEIPDPENIKYKKFALFTEQANVVERALMRAGAVSGSHKEGEQLTLIAEEYLANQETNRGLTAKVETLTRLSRILGMRIVIVDPASMNVVHGMDVLQDLATRAEADRVED